MSDTRYNLVFAGKVVPGADVAKVKQNLARLFKIDDAKVAALFSGKQVVLKKDADQATAMKFRATLKQAGAECVMAPVAEQLDQEVPAPVPTSAQKPPAAPVFSEPASAPKDAVPPSSAPVSDTVSVTADRDMVGTIRTGGEGFSGEFDVAPAGADMAGARDEPPPIVPDVSDISLAPAGSDMGQLKKQEAEIVPDISHLSVAPLAEDDTDNKASG